MLGGELVDAAGEVWNANIHSSPAKLNAGSGLWRRKRGSVAPDTPRINVVGTTPSAAAFQKFVQFCQTHTQPGGAVPSDWLVRTLRDKYAVAEGDFYNVVYLKEAEIEEIGRFIAEECGLVY